MTDDRIRAALEGIADPPTDTSGVADKVISQVGAAPPPGGGIGAAGNGAASGPWLAGASIAAAVALVAGIGFGLRSGDAGPVVETIDGQVGAAQQVSTYACPDGRDEVGTLGRGDRILAVAQSDDGSWIALRAPNDFDERVWVAAGVVIPDGELNDLPTSGCGDNGELALVSADGVVSTSILGAAGEGGQQDPTDEGSGNEPGPKAPGEDPGQPNQTTTPNAPGPTTTTQPAGPGPTPPPPTAPSTTAPDTSGPSLSNTSANPGEIWETFPGLCNGKPKTATIETHSSDPSGVAHVKAAWSVGGSSKNVTMTKIGSSTYRATFGPHAYGTAPSNGSVDVDIFITATDNKGNTSKTTTKVKLTSADLCFG